jgi:hypothetical protein
MNLEKIKKIAEKGKGGLKKTLTAAAIIATVTACGPSDKKSETTTPPDSTKTEEVAKDSIKKVDNSTEKDTKEKEINSIEDLDDETLAMFDEWDAIHKEEQKKLEEQTSKQTPREVLGITKKTYERGLSEIKESEKLLETLYNDKTMRETKEGLELIKKAIDNYNGTRKLINRPASPKAQKIINHYNQKKRELDN